MKLGVADKKKLSVKECESLNNIGMTQQKEVTVHLSFISKMTTNANSSSSSIVSLWPTKTKVLGDSAHLLQIM